MRRLWMAALMALLVGLAVFAMADLHYRSGFDGWRWAHLGLFTVLFSLVAFGTVQALVGFVQRRRKGGDPYRIVATLGDERDDEPLSAPTAVVMPVCNENPSRVFEGLRAIIESVDATGHGGNFHYFILSDSSDPNRWVEEEAAWIALTQQLKARGRIFYRKRRVNTNKKAGNMADFCRRWGSAYRYMVVLDADSIMTGESVVRLTRMMEANNRVGIIQTVPQLVRGETMLSRMQQFASRLYGSIFSAGLNSWQLGEGNYWGHNAIIRLEPFIRHCSLPDLPGAEPFGGRILSHDYVEAALMRRAGWAVWLAVDQSGSYEEGPTNLIDFAKRDRRWLQGNLQHTWLLTAKGLRTASRLHLFLGVMAFIASPLWLAFLVLSMVIVWRFEATGLTLLPGDGWLSPYHLPFGVQALGLFIFTLALLFLPKVLALVDLGCQRGAAKEFGGWPRVVASVVIETIAFTLIAPVLMLFHTKFVALTLSGKGVAWITQRRGADGEPEWREAILTHGGQTVFGVAWGALAWWIQPALAAWMSPILIGLAAAIPVSLLTGQVAWGRRLREWGLFLVPEETNPPAVLRDLEERLDACRYHTAPLPELADDLGLMEVVLDPYVNAVHLALLRERERRPTARERRMAELGERLLRDGPGKLTKSEKIALLQDDEAVVDLHREIWSCPTDKLAAWWQLAIRHYNVISPAPPTVLHR